MDTATENVNTENVTYEQLANVLADANAIVSTSEAHGLLCGFICAGRAADAVGWIESILGHIEADVPAIGVAKELLLKLYAQSSQEIHDMAFEFHLMLPNDDEILNDRAMALGEWCQGFMAGMGLGGLEITSAHSQDARDGIYHIAEISKIDYTGLDITEDDEKSFMEVSEYLRMAVLMIFSEFTEIQGTGRQSDAETKKSLH